MNLKTILVSLIPGHLPISFVYYLYKKRTDKGITLTECINSIFDAEIFTITFLTTAAIGFICEPLHMAVMHR